MLVGTLTLVKRNVQFVDVIDVCIIMCYLVLLSSTVIIYITFTSHCACMYMCIFT